MPRKPNRTARVDTTEASFNTETKDLNNHRRERLMYIMTRGSIFVLAVALICTASVLVAREMSNPSKGSEGQHNLSIPDLHDVWIPIELLNFTIAHNATSILNTRSTNGNHQSSVVSAKRSKSGNGVKERERLQGNNRGGRKQDIGIKIIQQGQGLSDQKDAKGSSTPKAEALRSSFVRKPLSTRHHDSIKDSHMTLFSVDSWMGNLSELPQPRVEELKALAAASMRNHEKTHPPKNRVIPPEPTAAASRATIAQSTSTNLEQIETNEDSEATVQKKEPSPGESITDEHLLSTDGHEDHGELADLGGDSGEFPHEDEIGANLGNSHAPACAGFHRFYCDSSDDYPTALINQVTKYLKWPLEKLFRDLRGLHPPTLADADSGNLVCDSITKIIRPGWVRNTNGKWLVVINTPYHVQTVTEIKCRAEGTSCSYIAPCFHSSCQQRYNIQSLLVIDPSNHYKGPFLSHFLFPSSCVCFVPNPKLVMQAQCQAVSKYGGL